MLSLAVTYADAESLGSRLRPLEDFALRVEEDGDRIRVALSDDGEAWG